MKVLDIIERLRNYVDWNFPDRVLFIIKNFSDASWNLITAVNTNTSNWGIDFPTNHTIADVISSLQNLEDWEQEVIIIKDTEQRAFYLQYEKNKNEFIHILLRSFLEHE